MVGNSTLLPSCFRATQYIPADAASAITDNRTHISVELPHGTRAQTAPAATLVKMTWRTLSAALFCQANHAVAAVNKIKTDSHILDVSDQPSGVRSLPEPYDLRTIRFELPKT